MTIAEAAWLAGFFDGEGTIVMLRDRDPRRSGCACMIAIYNTHRGALDRVQQITNAGTVGGKRVPLNRGAKPQWRWQLQRQRSVVDILRQIRPYLVVKHDAVTAMLDGWRDLKRVA